MHKNRYIYMAFSILSYTLCSVCTQEVSKVLEQNSGATCPHQNEEKSIPRFHYDKSMYLAWRRFLPLSLNYLLFFVGVRCFIYLFFCVCINLGI